MSNSRSDPEMDARRKVAFREEAQALREDLVRYVQEGDAGQALRATLDRLFREGLGEAVREALHEPEVQRALHVELTKIVTDGLNEQLRSLHIQIIEESKDVIASTLRSEELRGSLRQNLLEEVAKGLQNDLREGKAFTDLEKDLAQQWQATIANSIRTTVREAVQDPNLRLAIGQEARQAAQTAISDALARLPEFPFERPEPLALADRQSVLDSVIPPPQKENPPNTPRGLRLPWQLAKEKFWRGKKNRPAAIPETAGGLGEPSKGGEATGKISKWRSWAPAGIGIVLTLGLTYFILDCRLGLKQEQMNTRTTVRPPAGTDATPAAENEVDNLRNSWLNLMNSRFPRDPALINQLTGHPVDNQFSCWFPAADRKNLEKLKSVSNPQTFRKLLTRAFHDCVKKDYAMTAGAPNLVVYGTQNAAIELLGRTSGGQLVWCSQRSPNLPALTSFQIDGRTGPDTISFLNEILRCNRFDDRLEITDTSDVESYLFVLYVAIEEWRKLP